MKVSADSNTSVVAFFFATNERFGKQGNRFLKNPHKETSPRVPSEGIVRPALCAYRNLHVAGNNSSNAAASTKDTISQVRDTTFINMTYTETQRAMAGSKQPADNSSSSLFRNGIASVQSCLFRRLLVFRVALGLGLPAVLLRRDFPLELLGFHRHQERCRLAK